MREAIRYLNNAKGQLKTARIQGRFYAAKKPVRVAFSTACPAVLEAINKVLLRKGCAGKTCRKLLKDTAQL